MNDLPLAIQKVHLSIGMLHGEALIEIHDTLAFEGMFPLAKAKRIFFKNMQSMESKTNRRKLVCGYDRLLKSYSGIE